MRLISELETRLAAAEHELHDAAKFFIDLAEGFSEPALHRPVDIADDGLKPLPRFCEIGHLPLIEFPSCELPGVLLLALRIHTAQLSHAAGKVLSLPLHILHRAGKPERFRLLTGHVPRLELAQHVLLLGFELRDPHGKLCSVPLDLC